MQIGVVLAVLVGFVAGVAVTMLFVGRGQKGSMTSADPALVDASNVLGAEPIDPQPGSDLAALLEQIDQGVVWLSPNLAVTRLNRGAARMLQVDQQRVIGRSLIETFVDHRVEDAARAALAEGSASLEIIVRNDDQRRMSLRFRKSPGPGLWLLVDDVTELRRLQRIRTEFIDNLSHELRTPLTTIRLLTETLSQELEHPDVDVPARLRERIQKIDVETGHLVQMVNELLDLSRIESGAAELHFDNVKIADVIQGAVERLGTFAARQRIGLETDLGEVESPVIWADEERLGQVLVNLLHNAIKFSPPESAVAVSAGVADAELVVRVRDEGVGIPRNDLDRIFERFYKVDKARQRGQAGTGLGLAIARHIVQGHGGRIWAESGDGGGSVFTFTIPLPETAD